MRYLFLLILLPLTGLGCEVSQLKRAKSEFSLVKGHKSGLTLLSNKHVDQEDILKPLSEQEIQDLARDLAGKFGNLSGGFTPSPFFSQQQGIPVPSLEAIEKVANSLKQHPLSTECGLDMSDPDLQVGSGQVALMMAGFTAPIVASVVKLGADLAIDQAARRLEKVKKSSVTSFSNRSVMKVAELADASCLAIYRYDEKQVAKLPGDEMEVSDKAIEYLSRPDKHPADGGDFRRGFLAVLKIERMMLKGDNGSVAEGLYFKPLYVIAEDTPAFTIEPPGALPYETPAAHSTEQPDVTEKLPATINASIAVSVKAIGNDESGWPTTRALGEAVVTVPNIKLQKSINACASGCQHSDPIPLHSNGAKNVLLTMTVVETGNIGADYDRASAELKAIKEAIGPALKAGVEAYYKED